LIFQTHPIGIRAQRARADRLLIDVPVSIAVHVKNGMHGAERNTIACDATEASRHIAIRHSTINSLMVVKTTPPEATATLARGVLRATVAKILRDLGALHARISNSRSPKRSAPERA